MRSNRLKTPVGDVMGMPHRRDACRSRHRLSGSQLPPRGINHPWEEVEVELLDGQNDFLVKVSQLKHDWGFGLQGRAAE